MGGRTIERCWTGRWHKHDVGTGEWICTCEGADEYGDYTEARHSCDGWEERGARKDA